MNEFTAKWITSPIESEIFCGEQKKDVYSMNYFSNR